MSRDFSSILTPPDYRKNRLLLETPEELDIYIQKLIEQEEHSLKELEFYEDYGIKKKHLSSLYDSPLPGSIYYNVNYRDWMEDLCNEEYEYWDLKDARVPVPVKNILKLWADYYGTINFDRKCKMGDPAGTMDYYLNCSHTRPDYKGDYLGAKNFFKHVHFIYDYKTKEASYIIKDYKFLNPPPVGYEDYQKRLIDAGDSFRKDLTTSIDKKIKKFNIERDSVLYRKKVKIDLARDPIDIVEEMHDYLNCTPDETEFIPTKRRPVRILGHRFPESRGSRLPIGVPMDTLMALDPSQGFK